ncbi:MAG: S8 family serine peptidase, partial [Gemmatimonadota bacterium]
SARAQTAAPAQPVVPPEVAYARGWMPLRSTGVEAWRKAHPGWDGRGVLIGILDSGIDPGIPGLQLTTTGQPKILDLRDFSGEGRIGLQAVSPKDDAITVHGHILSGMGRAVALNPKGPYYAGVLIERPLGELPAADLNGDGDDADTLAVLVTRASDGWVLLADTDGDGTLANDKPIHDYLVARETFGWHPAGKPTPLDIAVNFADGPAGAPPVLDLFFDTSGHGSHVAGIASAHDMYGVPGFDGVAPGAQVIGLKISDNAQGGITTTGSILRAVDYAIRFAAARKLPLVLNMSFGVGNEREGTARIDHIVDSVLAAHPDVVWTISAGNDGPGLSTMGFPGSARRPITVGATFPLAFTAGPPEAPEAPDPLADFSSRGGPTAKPDIVTPGVAYSTIPRWYTGNERLPGTSMASPHAAGLAALLVSAARQQDIPWDALRIKQALMVTARPLADMTRLDQGAGLPDVNAAWAWLARRPEPVDVAVRAIGCSECATAAFRSQGLASPADTVQAFELTASGGMPVVLTFQSSADWLRAPPPVTVSNTPATVVVRYAADRLKEPGVYTGVVTGWGPDTLAGPLVRLVNTVIVPYPGGTTISAPTEQLKPGQSRRLFFPADSGRPFQVAVAAGTRFHMLTAALHEPGGMPFRDQPSLPAGFGPEAALFEVDGSDAEAGVYEVVATASPAAAASASIRVVHSPVRLAAHRVGDSAIATLSNVTADSAAGNVAMLDIGALRTVQVIERGSATRQIPFVVPAWATHIVVDVTMDREQWSRFTDFGVTLFHADGRQIEHSPLNYALGRLHASLPRGHGDTPVTLGLFPGFADPGTSETWRLTVRIRLYAEQGMPLEPAPGELRQKLSLAPRATGTVRFALPAPRAPMGDGFVPLGVVLFETGRNIWTREIGLAPDSPPLMR